MAKSLRSKSKRKFRTIRREKIHAPVEKERLARLAKKQDAEWSDVEENEEMEVQETVKDVKSEKPKDESEKIEEPVKVSSNLRKKNPELYLSGNQLKKLKRRQKQKAPSGGIHKKKKSGWK